MATNLPYTLQDIQDRLNVLVNNDDDTPDTSDEEWNLRLHLINQAIGKWESSDVEWDELWTGYTHGATVSAATTYSLSSLTDLNRVGGYLKLTLNNVNSYVEIISPEQYQSFHSTNTRVAWLTGNNKDGWTLNLGWTPASGDGTYGATIYLPYYKYAYRLSGASDKPEMADPNFIVYDAAAAKSLLEGRNNSFSIYSTDADVRMTNMRIKNDIKPNYNDNRIEDVDRISFGAVMGE